MTRSFSHTQDSKAPQEALESDPLYVHSKRFDFSLKKLRERYPEGAPNHVVAPLFLLTEEALVELYESIVRRLKNAIGV